MRTDSLEPGLHTAPQSLQLADLRGGPVAEVPPGSVQAHQDPLSDVVELGVDVVGEAAQGLRRGPGELPQHVLGPDLVRPALLGERLDLGPDGGDVLGRGGQAVHQRVPGLLAALPDHLGELLGEGVEPGLGDVA